MDPDSLQRTARWVRSLQQPPPFYPQQMPPHPMHQQQQSFDARRRTERSRERRQERPMVPQAAMPPTGFADAKRVVADPYDSLKRRHTDEPYSSLHRRGNSLENKSLPRPPGPHPRLNIPTVIYQNPNLPAFVQGPPGSGYPMNMVPAYPPPPPPSPPVPVPSAINPKKSRPTIEKRRPSLSGNTFEPPLPMPIHPTTATRYPPQRHNENQDPRMHMPMPMPMPMPMHPDTGSRRVRGRSASESRRR
ncbi:hypothetical protein SCHPADRAFT_893830 [Schizopora paradoxa]|uniref:Uncharacterized protein n=1 Tax=Schizopora paradoxa TaxID=27342 RepID=A0A0H2RUK7_9AGAM|nr:hypothetical protein SCHPADRAFT_893830 [Schizopora paradoxa]